MNIIISSFFKVTCTTFLFHKIISKENGIYFKPQKQYITYFFLFVFTCIAYKLTPTFFHFIFVILLFLSMTLIYKIKFDLTCLLVFLTYSIFLFIMYVCSLAIAIIYSIPYYNNLYFSNEVLVFLSGALTYLFIYFLSKIRRFQSSVKVLFKPRNIKIGLILSISVFCFKLFDNIYLVSNNYLSALPPRFALLLLAFLLFAWWRKQITKSYIEKLRKLEIQSLYDELEEKERLIKKLTADNESLSRIIHKDNKLIPAMEHAVTDFLSCNHMQDPESLKQYGKELSDRLQEMTRDRKGILTSYDDESRTLRLTNHFGIDAALVYMQKKAEANHVFLECKHSPEVVNYILTKISESDLADLLSDLIENAIISLNDRENGRITVTFGQFNKEGYISVADNGIPFDITTLHSLGLMQHTTHKDEGGSGIGLMAIWELKKKYRATIQIQEYGEKPEGFSKRILFSFNNKNHYVIQSYRHTDILNTQTRGDLYVIPADTKETNGGKTA